MKAVTVIISITPKTQTRKNDRIYCRVIPGIATNIGAGNRNDQEVYELKDAMSAFAIMIYSTSD